jgi:hypothetical protein
MHWMHIRQGRAHRSFCALIWAVTGLYLFLRQGGPESLLSWQALIYFVVGMLAASLVLGSFGAWAHKVLVQALLIALRPPGDASLGLIRVVGLAVLVAEALVVYQAALWAFGQNWGR